MIYKFNISRKSLHEKLRTSPMVVLALFLAVLAIPVIRLAVKANSLSDTTPMELVSFSLDAATIDVSNDTGNVGVIGEMTDDLSGFGSIEYYYTSPSGDQVVQGDFNGDPQYIDTNIQFPQYSEAGVWKPTITLKDAASNVRVYTPTDLETAGFTANITITSTPSDTTLPELVDMTFDTSTVDTTNGEFYFSGVATLTDDLAGVSLNQSFIVFTSPSGGQEAYASFTQVSGDTYTFGGNFFQYSELGVWSARLELNDKVNNTRIYDTSQLESLSVPTTVTVSGVQDITPVAIQNVQFTAALPPAGDLYPNSSKVTILGQFSDNLSGVGNVDLLFHSEDSTQTAITYPVVYPDGNYQFTIFMPVFASTGRWLPTMLTTDYANNRRTYSHEDLLALGIDLSMNVVGIDSGTVAVNETFTTDPEGNGATPSEPFEAEITSPVAGDVTVSQVSLTNPVSSNDFLVFDQQYDITAPAASVEAPLELSFSVDASALQGQTAATIVVFRNGELVSECTDPIQAVPDPCVSARATLPDGDVRLTVRSSHASVWVLGYAAPTGPTYSFKKFKGIQSSPALNKEKSGSTVPVKFKLGGDFGLSVLPAEIATSRQISCSTKAVLSSATDINVNGDGLKIKNPDEDEEDENAANRIVYRYNWKTLKSWKNTCRELTMQFSNGEEVNAYFDFR